MDSQNTNGLFSNDELSGLDREDLGEISHPFDPNRIRVRSWSPTVYNLTERLKHGEIDLSPEFQRRTGIWDEKKQSRLIESILIRIPLPAFYLDEIATNSPIGTEQFSVVDGVQRLHVLNRFINLNDLPLVGLEFLKRLETRCFSDLDSPLQRRILETQLTVHVAELGTPDEAKLNIFKRINTGGVELNPQEIRHAMSAGPVRDWLKQIAMSPEFIHVLGQEAVDRLSVRMEDRECIIRFVSLLDDGEIKYRDSRENYSDFDSFLLKGMSLVNGLSQSERDVIRSRFARAISASGDCLGKFAFRKITELHQRGPLNKALFEATTVAMDRLSDIEISKLKGMSELLIQKYAELMADSEFFGSISTGTGDPNKVERRIRKMYELYKEMLK